MDLPGGYKARPAVIGDVDAVAALTAAVDVDQGSEPTYRRDEILIDWNRPGFDITRDTWLIERGGQPAGFGHLTPRGNTDLIFMMWIHPDHAERSLPAALISPMEERARGIASESTYNRGVAIASENEALLRRAIESHGFEPDALFVEMVKDLDEDPASRPPPEGIELRALSPDEARPFYDVLVAAFSEHWGAGFPPFEEWMRDVRALEGYDPYLSLVAAEGEAMVGVLFAHLHGGLGEVYDVGVLPGHRGRGIGETLMLEIFRRFRSRGGLRARLWVDTANVTDAIKLYEKIGMEIARRMHFYAKELG